MAKQGFKVIDSDIHVVEPADLWQRYLEPEFVKQGPRPAESGKGLWQIGDRPVPVRADIPGRGAVALVLPNHLVKGRPFYDRYYDPLWATAVDLNVAIAFHGINLAHHGHVGVRYFDNFPMAHASGHAIESMLALGAMLTGGVFERFPALRAAFLEGLCSWAPSWLYCLDERWEKFGNERRYGLKHPPSYYFRRQCFLSVDADEELVVDTIKALGDDNIVISTDWPHGDSSFPQALNTFLKIDGVSDQSRRKILWDNCARLYNIHD